ncbi:hypothetical protein ACVWZV_002221 [Bradyrhizobium sp. GM5.1]
MSTNRYQVVDPVLSNISIGYQNDAYIAEQVFPSLPVALQSGKHFMYDKGMFTNTPNRRAAGSPSNEVDIKVTSGLTYFAEDHALKQFVPDEDVKNAPAGIDPMVDATENVTEMNFVAREVELAGIVTSTANLTQNTTLSGTSRFDDYSNSDPFATIETGMQTVHAAVFQRPNTVIMGKQVWDKLKFHPAFLERIKYTQRGQITPDLLAALLEVDRVLIGAAGKQTANEAQTNATSYIWGKDMVLAFINPRIGQKTISLGLNYTWQQRQVERLRGTDEEDRKGTYVRVGNWYYDQNLISASAGYLLKTVVS